MRLLLAVMFFLLNSSVAVAQAGIPVRAGLSLHEGQDPLPHG